MYRMVLFAHSYLRWFVLLLALFVCVRSLVAWRRQRAWESTDEKLSVALIVGVDLQLLLGLWLYIFLSPLSRAFLGDTGAAMKDPLLRFFGMEHVFEMLIALILFHVARAWSKKAESGVVRHRRVWTLTLAALLVTAIAIPWPGLGYGRPLLRGVSADSASVPASAD
jgi:hypothetical protein